MIVSNWDDNTHRKEQFDANLQQKREAAIRRERALTYAYSHQVVMSVFICYYQSAYDISFNSTELETYLNLDHKTIMLFCLTQEEAVLSCQRIFHSLWALLSTGMKVLFSMLVGIEDLV